MSRCLTNKDAEFKSYVDFLTYAISTIDNFLRDFQICSLWSFIEQFRPHIKMHSRLIARFFLLKLAFKAKGMLAYTMFIDSIMPGRFLKHTNFYKRKQNYLKLSA